MEFVTISEFPAYEVSRCGAIRNRKTLRIMKQQTSAKGYRMIGMKKDKKQYFKSVHRLVALSFIANHDVLPCINHISGVKSDNRVKNLEWCTYADNNRHAFKLGLRCNIGEMNSNARLACADVRDVRSRLANGDTHKAISERFGISIGMVSHIKSGRRWKSVQ